MIPIAHIENDFPTKFGIPRQSGRVGALKARIVFEPEYRNVDACRGLEEFSHIWLISDSPARLLPSTMYGFPVVMQWKK